MKNIIILLFSLPFTSNSFGMDSKETPPNKSVDFSKLEKRRLQEQNNALLQENNRLLRIIIHQNQLISRSERPTAYSIYTVQASYYKQLDAIYEEFKNDKNS